MPVFRIDSGDYPEEALLPIEFEEILLIGKKSAELELFGVIWHFSTLEDWERREIAKSFANLDILTRSVVMRMPTLVQAISSVSFPKTNKTFYFDSSPDKPILRSILLTLDSKVADTLFEAYQLLQEIAQREYDTKYGSLREKIKNDFFALSGESISQQVSQNSSEVKSSPEK